MRRRAGAGLVAGVVVLLGACSSGKDAPLPDDASPTPSATAYAPIRVEPGPLEEYIGAFGPADTPAGYVADIARREEWTAACMAEQGFEYWPQVPALDDVVYGDGPVQGTREFAELYGYGYWHPSPDSEGGITVLAGDGENPNSAYRAAMGEAEARAYDDALLGPIVEEHADGSWVRNGGGCNDPQGASLAGPDEAFLRGVLDEATTFLGGLSEDSRFDELRAEWSACMADAGFTETDPGTAALKVAEASTALYAEQPPTLDEIDRQAAAERRLALADLDCQESTDWAARYQATEFELQQEYVDAHLADLEALAEAMEPVTRGD